MKEYSQLKESVTIQKKAMIKASELADKNDFEASKKDGEMNAEQMNAIWYEAYRNYRSTAAFKKLQEA